MEARNESGSLALRGPEGSRVPRASRRAIYYKAKVKRQKAKVKKEDESKPYSHPLSLKTERPSSTVIVEGRSVSAS
jgi:hypothetical protein